MQKIKRAIGKLIEEAVDFLAQLIEFVRPPVQVEDMDNGVNVWGSRDATSRLPPLPIPGLGAYRASGIGASRNGVTVEARAGEEKML